MSPVTFPAISYTRDAETEVDPLLTKELTAAKIHPRKKPSLPAFIPQPGQRQAIPTNMLGILRFKNSATVIFLRCWAYWRAMSTVPVPRANVSALSRLPNEYYVRPHVAQTVFPVPREGCSDWSIGNQDGLVAFVEELVRAFGEPIVDEGQELFDEPAVQALVSDIRP